MGTHEIQRAQQAAQVGQQKPVVKKEQTQNAKLKGSVWAEGYAKKAQNGVVKGKVKGKNGNFIEKEYTKLKNLENGRSLVMDASGKQWVMAHDGVILKQEYVDKNPNGASKKAEYKASKDQLYALNLLISDGNKARKSFDAQMAKDGWAADAADGISKIWNNKVGEKLGISTGNTASQVRDDFKTHNKNMKDLRNAAKQGEAEFNATFKKIYGVDYNQKAVENFRKNPTEENYIKAFGKKQKHMSSRVEKYNQSQEAGATAVKTTAKVGVGIGVGLATGGVGLAVGTAVGSALIEETDRVKVTGEYKDSTGKTVKNTKGDKVFKEGTDHTKILKDAVVDGVMVYGGGKIAQAATKLVPGKVLTNAAGEVIAVSTVGQKIARVAIAAAGDGVLGAGAEYVQTGEVTAGGVATNMAMSFGIGSAVEFGLPQIAFNSIKRGFDGKSGKYKVTPQSTATKPKAPKDPNATTKAAVKTSATQGLKKSYQAPKTQQTEFVLEDDLMAGGFFKKIFGGDKKPESPKRTGGIPQESIDAAKAKMKAATQKPKQNKPAENNPAGIEIVNRPKSQSVSLQPTVQNFKQNPVPQTPKPVMQPRPIPQTPATQQPKSAPKMPSQQVKSDTPTITQKAKANSEKPENVTQKRYQRPEVNSVDDKLRVKMRDEIYDKMDVVLSKQKAITSSTEKLYENKFLALQEKQEKLKQAYKEQHQKNKADLNKKMLELEEVEKNIREEKKILDNFAFEASDNVEIKIITYDRALEDLKKYLNGDRTVVIDIGEYAPKRNKRFIGAEFKDNLTETIVPQNAPSYFHDSKIADFFHYKDLKGLSQYIAKMKSDFSTAKSQVEQAQIRIGKLKNKKEKLYAERKTIEDANKVTELKYNQDNKNLQQQIENAEKERKTALSKLKQSPTYVNLHEEFKTLQNMLKKMRGN